MDASDRADESWLDDYELGETVVAFGTTVTRRARRRHDDMPVRIKTARAGARKLEWARTALERERRILAEVDHPAMPVAIDVVRAGPRIALVFADHGGHRLDVVLERLGRLTPEGALAVGVELCDALAALHRRGHAHGLLRPRLVELTEGGRVYLHAAGQLPRGAERGQDELLELPEHMAPEMVLGDEADELTDVFLLGMTLHQLVTGGHPFAGDEAGITQRIRHASAPSIRREVPDAPSAMDRIVKRALEKRRRDRHPDVISLQSELVRALRAQTALPIPVLVGRALAAAGLGDDPPAPREPQLNARRGMPRWLRRGGLTAGALATASLGLWLGVEACGEDETPTSRDPRGIVEDPARIRLLAEPWAEIHIDGARVDVTPIGRPVEVSPGRHDVVFRHPHAPEERRTVEVIPGQTVVLDVDMQIERPEDAGTPEAGAEELSP